MHWTVAGTCAGPDTMSRMVQSFFPLLHVS